MSNWNQKPWFGTAVTSDGSVIRVSGWTLGAAKSFVETKLQ